MTKAPMLQKSRFRKCVVLLMLLSAPVAMQVAVAQQSVQLPDPDGKPAAADKSVSPSGAGYHYNHNAETYMEVGNALGWAMAELLAGED
ncbi:hypothetical protein [Planctomycetes bacterium TBK1r]|uniref:Uncharacterized protein n=1 Tax=Stieleria magnilauensis TaxID=2527963 RepID=A0ABX5XY36_9BACT|nr:hypothetical protein TBK1r_36960 [Planctomycetes bacterium TBK1r]